MMKTQSYSNLRLTLVIYLCFLSFHSLSAQNYPDYAKEYFIKSGDTLRYRILLPNNFDETKSYPMVLFLHGSGERGNDNEKQLAHGGDLFLKYRDSFPAIVIFPQCSQEDYWSNVEIDRNTVPLTLKFPLNQKPTKAMTMLMEFLDMMTIKDYVNKNQVYLGGLSMGGMGTFEMLYRKPNTFAAAFSICGAGNPESTDTYAKLTPMWIFHGAHDDVVNPLQSIGMVAGILKNGGKPNVTIFAKDNHNSWDSAFAEPQLIPWLFSNSKIQQ